MPGEGRLEPTGPRVGLRNVRQQVVDIDLSNGWIDGGGSPAATTVTPVWRSTTW